MSKGNNEGLDDYLKGDGVRRARNNHRHGSSGSLSSPRTSRESPNEVRQRIEKASIVLQGICDGPTLYQIRLLGKESRKYSEIEPRIIGKLVALELVQVGDGDHGLIHLTPYGRLVWLTIRGLIE